MVARNLRLHAPAERALAAPEFGALPEWRLEHLYAGMDSPDFAADLARAREDAKAFAAAHKGRLAELLAQGGDGLAAGDWRNTRRLQDLMGRLMSYASLTYAGDTSDPARAKFYGDAQEQSDRDRQRPAVFRIGD